MSTTKTWPTVKIRESCVIPGKVLVMFGREFHIYLGNKWKLPDSKRIGIDFKTGTEQDLKYSEVAIFLWGRVITLEVYS